MRSKGPLLLPLLPLLLLGCLVASSSALSCNTMYGEAPCGTTSQVCCQPYYCAEDSAGAGSCCSYSETVCGVSDQTCCPSGSCAITPAGVGSCTSVRLVSFMFNYFESLVGCGRSAH